MIKIYGFGAYDEVGRSSILIKNQTSSVMLDCGVKIFPRRMKKRSEPPIGITEEIIESLDAIILSHAHLDHSGYIPALVKRGFHGKIYMTEPTKELVQILWKDHVKIEEGFHYTKKDIQATNELIETAKYNQEIQLRDDISFQFLDAAHILGSASVFLRFQDKNIYYTGDINNAKSPYHDPVLGPDPDEKIDVLITEATNAVRPIRSRKVLVHDFFDVLKKKLKHGGKVFIPAFAMGRSQEIQSYLLQFLTEFGDYPVYVDGMIQKMNRVYEKYLTREWISFRALDQLNEHALESPWDHEAIMPIEQVVNGHGREFTRKTIARDEEPSIILTTSGMLEGGPIHSYLRYGGANTENLLLTVGYQAEGTLGRDIINGNRLLELYDYHENVYHVHLGCRHRHFDFSGHISLSGLEQFVLQANPRLVVPVHGSEESFKVFSETTAEMGYKVRFINPEKPLIL